MGLTGWVRNRGDDSVEIVAEGESNALTAFAVWCRHGPMFAHVEHVEETFEPPRGEFRTFEIEDSPFF